MNPLALKAQLWLAGGAVVALLSATSWALLERSGRLEAKATNAYLAAQGQVLAGSVAACSKGAEEVRAVAERAIAGLGEAREKIRRATLPQQRTVERIETIIERQVPAAEAADCNWAWGQIEQGAAGNAAAPPKAGAAP